MLGAKILHFIIASDFKDNFNVGRMPTALLCPA